MSKTNLLVFAMLLAWPMFCACAKDPAEKYGQFAPADAYEEGSSLAYYGSENEWSRRQFESKRVATQPKRLGQRLILAIQDGNPEVALQESQEFLAQEPGLLEALFAQAVAQAQLGDVEQALTTMRRALDGGLPFERFVAGPRELLAPLTSSARFQAELAERPVHLIHGPMLGAMTDTSVRVWMRTVDESQVTVRIFAKDQEANDGEPVAIASGQTDRQMDYTGIVTVAGLQPDTSYSYDVLVDGETVLSPSQKTFRTFPRAGAAARFQVAFGGGAGYTLEHERMWDTIAAKRPRALLLLGDNVYIDLPEEIGPLHRYTYYRRQSQPEFRRLTAAVPVFATWDDHDAAIDDVWLGPYRDKPAWKPSMLQLQQENWNNPAYGDPEWPGCWFHFAMGDVDFFVLDCRYYRTNPFGEARTMLGPVQKAWLLQQLRDSSATFKVVASSVPWAPEAKPGSRDTWDGFPEEREEIFTWIERNAIEGVLLLSADRHRSDARKISRTTGYPLYDLMSSRLTNVHTHELIPGALFGYNEKCSFGLLTFDTQRADPSVTFDIVNIDGETTHSLNIERSRLTFPSTDAPR